MLHLYCTQLRSAMCLGRHYINQAFFSKIVWKETVIPERTIFTFRFWFWELVWLLNVPGEVYADMQILICLWCHHWWVPICAGICSGVAVHAWSWVIRHCNQATEPGCLLPASTLHGLMASLCSWPLLLASLPAPAEHCLQPMCSSNRAAGLWMLGELGISWELGRGLNFSLWEGEGSSRECPEPVGAAESAGERLLHSLCVCWGERYPHSSVLLPWNWAGSLCKVWYVCVW